MNGTETPTPPLPADPGARTVYENWYATLAATRAVESQPAPATVEPDPVALRLLAATQGEINRETGKRYYDESPKFRNAIETLRVQALEGKWNEAAARRAVAEALGRPVKEQPQPVAPVGSPEDRAIEAAFTPADKIPPETWQGFEPVNLPDGVGVNAEALSPYLTAAKAAGCDQQQVAAFITGLAESEANAGDSIVRYSDAAELARDDWAGYSPIRLPPGVAVDRDDFRDKLALARRAGLSQDQVAAGLAAYLSRLD